MKQIYWILLLVFTSLYSQSSLNGKLSQYLLKGEQARKNVRLDSMGLQIKTTKKVYRIPWDSLEKLLVHYEYQSQEQKRKWLILQLHNQFFGLPKFTGFRIALDPGHFAGDLATAQIEGKYLKMTLPDSTEITFFESSLAWATAKILADSLQKHGAEVMITRSKHNFTAFEKTFEQIYFEYTNSFTNQSKSKPKKLKPLPRQLFFRNHFKKKELEERVHKINAFQPDITLIIHYNVDENNAPWKQTTTQNFAVAFVAGAFEAEYLQKTEEIETFIRLLCSFQIERSIQLAEKTLEAHEKIANVPIVPLLNEQPFLQKYCLWTGSKGVYARNLMLCREIKGIVCYGESLLQDNEQEIRKLNLKTLIVGDLLTSPRVLEVANAYWHGICNFLW